MNGDERGRTSCRNTVPSSACPLLAYSSDQWIASSEQLRAYKLYLPTHAPLGVPSKLPRLRLSSGGSADVKGTGKMELRPSPGLLGRLLPSGTEHEPYVWRARPKDSPSDLVPPPPSPRGAVSKRGEWPGEY